MNVEARLLGGPAEGEIFAIRDIMHEIKIAHAPPLPRAWWGTENPSIEPIRVDHHIYEPVRAVVYYEHRGKR